MATFSSLIEGVQVRLGEVRSTAADLYSEEVLGAYIQDAFELVFDELWIPEYRVILSRTLDAATGIVTQDVADTTQSEYISHYKDIQLIFPDGSDQPLRQLPTRVNPSRFVGTYPRFVSPYAGNRLFKVWPIEAAGGLTIIGRQRPVTPFNASDDLKIDRLLLTLGACWLAMESDSTSPGAAENFQNLFNSRLRTERGNMNNQPLALNSSSTGYPTQWEDCDNH